TTPFPYAVGVDPFLHRAIVAFSTSNLGVLVNLNPDTASTCLPLSPGASPATPNVCVIGFVTLSTGASPQIAFEPLGHIAYVPPGGTGILEGVDLSATSHAPVQISKLTRTANTVQVTTVNPHGINSGIPSFGAPTVLVSGVPNGVTNNTSFNGAFQVTAV